MITNLLQRMIYLGLIINQTLLWKTDIEHVNAKITSIIKKLKNLQYNHHSLITSEIQYVVEKHLVYNPLKQSNKKYLWIGIITMLFYPNESMYTFQSFKYIHLLKIHANTQLKFVFDIIIVIIQTDIALSLIY